MNKKIENLTKLARETMQSIDITASSLIELKSKISSAENKEQERIKNLIFDMQEVCHIIRHTVVFDLENLHFQINKNLFSVIDENGNRITRFYKYKDDDKDILNKDILKQVGNILYFWTNSEEEIIDAFYKEVCNTLYDTKSKFELEFVQSQAKIEILKSKGLME